MNTTRLLMMVGDLVVGWLLLKQADVALKALKVIGVSDTDKDFYEGKVSAAKWFAQNRLPLLSSEKTVVLSTDLNIMDVPEGSW